MHIVIYKKKKSVQAILTFIRKANIRIKLHVA